MGVWSDEDGGVDWGGEEVRERDGDEDNMRRWGDEVRRYNNDMLRKADDKENESSLHTPQEDRYSFIYYYSNNHFFYIPVEYSY